MLKASCVRTDRVRRKILSSLVEYLTNRGHKSGDKQKIFIPTGPRFSILSRYPDIVCYLHARKLKEAAFVTSVT